MYTYDEWGNTMLHIQTGREGLKMFKEMGFENSSKEEYEKHMNSYRKIREEQDKRIWDALRKALNLRDDWNK